MHRRGFLALGGSSLLAGCSDSGDQPGSVSVTTSRTNTSTVTTTTTTTTPTRIGTRSGLLEAISSASSGDVVAVAPDAKIDLSGLWNVTIPAGVTLRGGRGVDGSDGALLYSPPGDETPRDEPTLEKFNLGAGARFLGFRLRGHHHEYVNPEVKYDGNYYAHRGNGLRVGTGAEVANNEISGWIGASVVAQDDAHVHHNFIHHNAWEGLGYGVVVPAGDHMPLIEHNVFNYNRHSIAGSGGPNVGYVARYNVVCEDWVGHQFDMHGSEGMSGIAGDEIIIEYNAFRATRVVDVKSRPPDGKYPAIKIRGVPTKGVWVRHNWFFHESREGAYEQTNGPKRAYFADNHYGRNSPPGWASRDGCPGGAGPDAPGSSIGCCGRSGTES